MVGFWIFAIFALICFSFLFGIYKLLCSENDAKMFCSPSEKMISSMIDLEKRVSKLENKEKK